MLVARAPILAPILQASWATVSQNTAMSLAALVLLSIPFGSPLQTAPLNPAPWRWFLIVTIAITAAITLFTHWFETTTPGAQEAGDQVARSLVLGRSVSMDLAVILGIVVFAPLGEELIFRALIFRGLRDGLAKWLGLRASVIVATLISAYLFATAHGGEGQDAQIAAMLVIGGLLALLYELTGTLAAPIMAHSVNNMMALSQMVGQTQGVAFSVSWLHWALYLAPLLLLAALSLTRRSRVS